MADVMEVYTTDISILCTIAEIIWANHFFDLD